MEDLCLGVDGVTENHAARGHFGRLARECRVGRCDKVSPGFVTSKCTAGWRILADRETYGDHLAGIPAGGERMEWALEEIRETLARDDKHLAEGRERERKSEQTEKRDQTKKQSRKTAKRKRKGRYQSRGLRM